MTKLVIIHKDLLHPYTGGQYRLAEIVSYLKKKKINMHVIDCGGLSEKVKASRIQFILFFIKFYLKNRKNIFTLTNHGIHFRLLIPLFISRITGNKYAINCNQSFYNFRKNFLLKWIEFLTEFLFLQSASLLIFPSRVSINFFKALHIKRKPHAVVNPAPVTICRGRPSFRNEVKKLIFVGQVRWWKGLDVLVKALADLKHLDMQLDIAGRFNPKSTYFKAIMEMIARYQLKNMVVFRGNVSSDQLASLYRNADICIFPSRYETFGIVLLEAMSFGLPIVASSIPSVKEIVRNMVNGIIYETENPSALARAILTLSSEIDLRKTIHENNLHIGKTLRSWEIAASETYAAVKKFLVRQNRCTH